MTVFSAMNISEEEANLFRQHLGRHFRPANELDPQKESQFYKEVISHLQYVDAELGPYIQSQPERAKGTLRLLEIGDWRWVAPLPVYAALGHFSFEEARDAYHRFLEVEIERIGKELEGQLSSDDWRSYSSSLRSRYTDALAALKRGERVPVAQFGNVVRYI